MNGLKTVRWTGCVFVVLSALTLSADTAYPIPNGVRAQNRARVEAFRASAYWKDAPFAVAAVEPISDVPRTPDLFPSDGEFTEPVRVVAAKGEFEPASVLLYGFADLKDVSLAFGSLANEKGDTLSPSSWDAAVVKVWYQQASSWYSYFSESTARKTIPELLLHDENLVHADFTQRENYLRIIRAGETSYRWISNDGSAVDHSGDGHTKNEWIRDARTLQPFAVRKDEFKQLWFTLHVPESAAEGLYRGTIAIRQSDGRTICSIPVEVRVLPFVLPQPATFRDLNRRFYGVCYLSKQDRFYSAKFRDMWRLMAEHGVRNPLLEPVSTEAEAREMKETFEATGMDTGRLFCALPGCGVRTSYPPREDDKDILRYTSICRDFTNSVRALRRVFGAQAKLYSYGIDEGSAATVRAERSMWKNVHENGANVVVSTRYHPFLLFNLDFANVPGQPRVSRREITESLHAANPDTLVGWYCDPHSGPENPCLARRVYGWQSWRNNYDSFCQYCLCRNSWYEFYCPGEPFLRGLQLVYPTADSLVCTLQFEGLREGVDDIRYGTYLRQLAEEGRRSPDVETQYAARAAGAYLAQVDFEHADPKALRYEMIERILRLRKALGKTR